MRCMRCAVRTSKVETHPLEFGSGLVACFLRAASSRAEKRSWRPMMRKGGKALDVVLTLSEPVWAVLERDREFRRFKGA